MKTEFTRKKSLACGPTETHPSEIAISLERLRSKYPDSKQLGFLMMRFTAAKPLARIVDVIKQTAACYGVEIIRADENEFHADLWGNVRTHLHGCGFGIAIYERIEAEEPNANVGLEVGYLMAMNKPVLLLKDKTVPTLQSDLAGKLYRQFDPHDPEGTIPKQLSKWLEDNGIALPRDGSMEPAEALRLLRELEHVLWKQIVKEGDAPLNPTRGLKYQVISVRGPLLPKREFSVMLAQPISEADEIALRTILASKGIDKVSFHWQAELARP